MTAQVPLTDNDETMPAVQEEPVAPPANPNPPARVEPPIPKLKVFRCSHCQKTYKTRPGLMRHVLQWHQKLKTVPSQRPKTRNAQPAPPTGGQRRSKPEAERTMMNPKQFHALNTTDGGRPRRVAKRVAPPKKQNQTAEFPSWDI